MSQYISLKASGLHTNENSLSTPDGALAIASNVVINSDNVIESRRGFERMPSFLLPADRADALTIYQNTLIAHKKIDNKFCYFNGSTWIDYAGTYAHFDSDLARIRFIQMNSNLYFSTADGLKMTDTVSGPIYSTGLPKALSGTAVTTGISGFLANNTAVAYRVIWGTRDANSNLYLGAPSQRFIVSNTSGSSKDVELNFLIPAGLTTSEFFQVYRSAQSSSSSTEPNDELQLVYEANPSSAEITAGAITFTDSTPDSLRGAALYSNANQEGISETNDEPPVAADLAVFQNFLFFANIKTKHRLTLSLLGVGGTNGLQLNDTITINGLIYTAKASTTIASREFKIFTSGSAAQNVEDTAKELISVINKHASNTTVYAYYMSNYTDLPGQIMIEERSISSTAFTVSVSKATAFNLDNSGVSINSEYANGLMWSKLQQPEHVPSSHLQLIGTKASPILRIIPLKHSLFILKTEGIYRLTGNNGNWSVELFDSSTKLLAPESAVVLNNQIYAFTDQGVCAISDTGIQVVSRPIEDKLTELIGYNLNNLKALSFGISYETDRKYILSTISSAADTFCTQQFVYNTFTNSWTIYDKAVMSGIVSSSDDKIYFGSAESEYILKERKSFSYLDYADEPIDNKTLISSSGTSLILNNIDEISVGDLVYSSDTVYSPIAAIDASTNTIILNTAKPFSLGPITILKAIKCEVEWINQAVGNPAVMKHFQEAQLLFKKTNFIQANLSCYTDLSPAYESTVVSSSYGQGWGSNLWGSSVWGSVYRPSIKRVFVPRNKSRGSLISLKYSFSCGFADWSLQGISLFFDSVSERLNK